MAAASNLAHIAIHSQTHAEEEHISGDEEIYRHALVFDKGAHEAEEPVGSREIGSDIAREPWERGENMHRYNEQSQREPQQIEALRPNIIAMWSGQNYQKKN